MKRLILALASTLIAGCASTPRNSDVAPYTAVVVFQWLSEKAEAPLPSPVLNASYSPDSTTDGGSPIAGEVQAQPREWVENQIVLGLEDYQVFSDFVVADWGDMHRAASAVAADVIVIIRIGSLAVWKPEDVEILPGLAALDAVLWFATAIGGWWVPDRKFSTTSDVEVFWKRPSTSSRGSAPLPKTIADVRAEFQLQERVTSGDYALSLWDRAKFWKAPVPYLMNVLIPAAFIPLHDAKEVGRSLAEEAVKDINRELAQLLGGGQLGSAGGPFLFRLESPRNGSTLEGSSVSLQYRYRVEPGFRDHESTLLRRLKLHIKNERDERYTTIREYSGETIRGINERIASGAPIDEQIDRLGVGLNLVRFSAQAELGGQWTTNTIVLRRR